MANQTDGTAGSIRLAGTSGKRVMSHVKVTPSWQRQKLISDKISVEMLKTIFLSNFVQSRQRFRVKEISAFRWNMKLPAICWNLFKQTAETSPRLNFAQELSDNRWKIPLQAMDGHFRTATSSW